MPAGKKTPRQRRAAEQTRPPGEYERDWWLSDWVVVKRSLQAGEFPPEAILANDLRGDEPVPREVREFLAEQIEAGRLKRPHKGAPPEQHIIFREIDDNALVASYEFHFETARWQKDCGEDLGDTPSTIALERATVDWAESEGYSPSYIENNMDKLVERVRKRLLAAKRRRAAEANPKVTK